MLYTICFSSHIDQFFSQIKEAYNTKPTVELVFVLTAARKPTALGPLLGEDVIFQSNLLKRIWDMSNNFVLIAIPSTILKCQPLLE